MNPQQREVFFCLKKNIVVDLTLIFIFKCSVGVDIEIWCCEFHTMDVDLSLIIVLSKLLE